MKLFIDGNNISCIAYYQAKKIMMGDVKTKFGIKYDPLVENEASNYINNNMTSFSLHIFLNIFHKYIKENVGREIFMVWDGRYGSAWRKDENENYKSNRDHSSDNTYNHFLSAIALEIKILDLYPIHQLKFENIEADDVIYNLCDIYKGEDIRVITSDGDLLQLMQKFDNVSVWNPKKKALEEKPEIDVILYKAIAGDSSDNIMGLYKFGPKKTLKAIEENLVNMTDEQLQQIEKNKIIIDLEKNPNAINNKKMVIKLLDDSKINMEPEKIKKIYFDNKLLDFLKRWDHIIKLLRQLERESIDGREKKGQSD